MPPLGKIKNHDPLGRRRRQGGVDIKWNGLGYRAMQKTRRQEHELKVPWDLVYVMMQDVDPEGLQARGGIRNPKQKQREMHH